MTTGAAADIRASSIDDVSPLHQAATSVGLSVEDVRDCCVLDEATGAVNCNACAIMSAGVFVTVGAVANNLVSVSCSCLPSNQFEASVFAIGPAGWNTGGRRSTGADGRFAGFGDR